MFVLTKKIKIFSLTLIILGLLGIAFGFYSAPSTIEEAKEIIANSHHGDDHASNHDYPGDANSSMIESNKEHNSEHSEGHEMSHDEHVFHQLANRPWAALYVAA